MLKSDYADIKALNFFLEVLYGLSTKMLDRLLDTYVKINRPPSIY